MSSDWQRRSRSRRAATRRRSSSGAPGCSTRSRSRWASSSPGLSARWTGIGCGSPRRVFGRSSCSSAVRLALPLPDLPWHTQRDRVCEIAAVLGLLAATLGKLARDLALLAQTEVAEVFEPAAPGRGGSSTMPHKRNPVGASVAIAAALRIPGLVATMLGAAAQEHERGLGNWPAEWETLPEIALLVAGALAAMVDVAPGLDVDADRMRANLGLTHGQIFAEAVQMALAPTLGRDHAHALVADACRRAAKERAHLREVLRAVPEVASALDATALDRLFDPAGYLGESGRYIERALAAHPA